jgi:GTP-binding protein
MTKLNYQNAKFLLSVAMLDQLPPDEGAEVAIIGRSNAGKSSVLNQLTQNKSLARTSKTPGRTQLINLFSIDEAQRIADLPGYGYAKVSEETKKKWQQLLDAYLRNRECLRGLILVMDSRHPLKEFDQRMLSWCHECALPVHILLNKIDKLTQSAAMKTLKDVNKEIEKNYPSQVTVQTFSALKSTGIDSLRKKLDEWLSR